MDDRPLGIRAFGPEALLVEVPRGQAARWARAITTELVGTTPAVEVVPAAATVLVRLADRTHRGRATETIAALRLAPEPPAADGDEVVIPVVYDGVDLAEVAAAAGITTAEVVARHTDTVYTAEFLGFAPGFAYLTGLPEELHLPRRATPRTRVPAGSVAIADRYSAVYPGASPGGWHLLGTAQRAVWDPQRDPPALVTPGARVRFEAVAR
jgi:KipI family sensor histidine kinase inhibitor